MLTIFVMQRRGGIQQRLARDKRPPIASNVALFLIRAWAWGEISPQFVQKVRCAFVIRSACKMTAPPQTKSSKIVSRRNQKQFTEMVPRNDTYNGFRESPQNMFDEIVPINFFTKLYQTDPPNAAKRNHNNWSTQVFKKVAPNVRRNTRTKTIIEPPAYKFTKNRQTKIVNTDCSIQAYHEMVRT